MDVKLPPAPNLNDVDQSLLYTYLLDVSTDSQFATSVLQILVKERRTSQRTRYNSQRTAKLSKVGDVVKAHVQVHSNIDKNVVGKLYYQGRGLFPINEILDENLYIVQRYN